MRSLTPDMRDMVHAAVPFGFWSEVQIHEPDGAARQFATANDTGLLNAPISRKRTSMLDLHCLLADLRSKRDLIASMNPPQFAFAKRTRSAVTAADAVASDAISEVESSVEKPR